MLRVCKEAGKVAEKHFEKKTNVSCTPFFSGSTCNVCAQLNTLLSLRLGQRTVEKNENSKAKISLSFSRGKHMSVCA